MAADRLKSLGASEPPGHLAAVEFELTPEDWVEASVEHAERHPMTRKAFVHIRGLFAALMVVLALLTWTVGLGSTALVWLLGGGVGLAALGPLLRNAQRTSYRRYAEAGIANGTFGHHRIELRPDGLLDVTEAYERLTRWSAVERVEQGQHAFLVYLGPNAFLPIPHSAFRDAEALRGFGDAFHALRAGAEAGPSVEIEAGEEPVEG